MRRLDGIINTMDMSLSKFQGIVKDREAGMLQSIGLQRAGDWTAMNNDMPQTASDPLWPKKIKLGSHSSLKA